MATGALAQSQFDAGQISLARETINKAVKERDDIVDLQLLRARIEIAARAPANAFSAYNNALSLDSGNMEALMGVAQIGLQLGRLHESEDAVDRVLTLAPRQPNALIIKGLHNIIRRRYADTMANADTILERSPADESASVLKARSLALLGREDEAMAVIENARKASGDTRGIALTLIELYRERGDGPAMLTQLEWLRNKGQTDGSRELDEADTLYKLGQTERARAFLSRLILLKGIDDAQAAAIVRLWTEYEPTPLDGPAFARFAAEANLPARKAVARMFLDRDDSASAAAALRNAPAVEDVLALLARIAVAQGRIGEGQRLAESILARDKTHCDALLADAQADLARKRFNDAIVGSQAAIGSCPQLVTAYLVLARAQELNGSPEAAGIAFRDAFDRNDQDSRLARVYTDWLVRRGQGTRALAVARRLTNNARALLSGWRLYGELCASVPDAGCAADAAAGLAAARKRFGPDPRTGELPPTGLFGRLTR